VKRPTSILFLSEHCHRPLFSSFLPTFTSISAPWCSRTPPSLPPIIGATAGAGTPSFLHRQAASPSTLLLDEHPLSKPCRAPPPHHRRAGCGDRALIRPLSHRQWPCHRACPVCGDRLGRTPCLTALLGRQGQLVLLGWANRYGPSQSCGLPQADRSYGTGYWAGCGPLHHKSFFIPLRLNNPQKFAPSSKIH
jgi:hypothetical protein